MKKIFTLFALMGGAFTLSGCELNNQEMESIISKCKEDTECKAILDKEIDEALAERGIFGYDYQYDEDYDVFYELDLTDEEKALLETVEALDNELWEKLDSMTEEELTNLEIKEFESVLGRSLTDAEKEAFKLIDALYNVDEEYQWAKSEIAYLEFYLNRDLTVEEKAAFDLLQADGEWTEAHDAAELLIENLYEELDNITEVQELEIMLKRELTEEEKAAFTLVDAIDFEDMDIEQEFTPEQEAAFEIIDALYEEAYTNYESFELELFLGRELTVEEKAALETIENVYKDMDKYWEENDYDEETEKQHLISYYESVLERELTATEKEAIEFSSEFYFYDDCEEVYFEDWDEFEDFEENHEE